MPEGDSIHRLAARLGPRLIGRVLDRVIVRGVPRGPVGTRVTGVEAIGKHLVIATDDGSEIRTHLGMNGSWRRHEPGEPVFTGGDRVSLVLVTADDAFVCRRAATVELSDRRSPQRGMAVAALGPDLLDREVDLDRVIERVAEQPATRPIGEVLLDQRIAAGIGNIWRCESLFQVGIDPRTPIGEVDPDEVVRVYQVARQLMRRSVDELHRPPSPHVHDRAGLPCRTCSERITAYRLGERLAFSCPGCQPRSRPR